jgi:tRNA(fMet)-specific endonuclease VapC
MNRAGLILDTGVPIAAERSRTSVEEMLRSIRNVFGEVDLGISTVSVVELTHGIYRARTDRDRTQRRDFSAMDFRNLMVYPVSMEIAQLAGRIEGEQAAVGIAIPFADLAIGATALYLGFDVVTRNVHRFGLIPGLKSVAL